MLKVKGDICILFCDKCYICIDPEIPVRELPRYKIHKEHFCQACRLKREASDEI
jgi:hypothetical protein